MCSKFLIRNALIVMLIIDTTEHEKDALRPMQVNTE